MKRSDFPWLCRHVYDNSEYAVMELSQKNLEKDSWENDSCGINHQIRVVVAGFAGTQFNVV